jgi:hypothetical protein
MITVTTIGTEMQATTARIGTGETIIGTEETITATITGADALTNGTITEVTTTGATITAETVCLTGQHLHSRDVAKEGHRKMITAETTCLTDQHNRDVAKEGHHKLITADVVTITALTLPITTAGAAEVPVHKQAIFLYHILYPKRPAVIDRGLFLFG